VQELDAKHLSSFLRYAVPDLLHKHRAHGSTDWKAILHLKEHETKSVTEKARAFGKS